MKLSADDGPIGGLTDVAIVASSGEHGTSGPDAKDATKLIAVSATAPAADPDASTSSALGLQPAAVATHAGDEGDGCASDIAAEQQTKATPTKAATKKAAAKKAAAKRLLKRPSSYDSGKATPAKKRPAAAAPLTDAMHTMGAADNSGGNGGAVSPAVIPATAEHPTQTMDGNSGAIVPHGMGTPKHRDTMKALRVQSMFITRTLPAECQTLVDEATAARARGDMV